MILATALFAALAAGPTVSLETSMGTIRVELDQAKAPKTVENFLTYVRAGHYDGTIFHRVIPNFMIQGGGMAPSMREKPTRPPIANEAKNGLRNVRGSIAMARTNDPNSATSQFFINVKDNAMLDYGVGGAGYAVFGRVVSGMDVVDRIVNASTTTKGPHQNVPIEPITIQKARVEDAAAAPASAPTTGAPPSTTPSRPASPRPASMPSR
jgi:peptidyl-prolyl cis-trans isomerase A (cyclophilin A)